MAEEIRRSKVVPVGLAHLSIPEDSTASPLSTSHGGDDEIIHVEAAHKHSHLHAPQPHHHPDPVFDIDFDANICEEMIDVRGWRGGD